MTQEPARLSPKDRASLKLLNELTLKRNFAAAHALSRHLFEAHPQHTDTVMWYAGIKREIGDTDASAAIMRDHYRQCPVRVSKMSGPAVLSVRGFENTIVKIGRNDTGDLSPMLQGGHFTLRTLLPPDALPQRALTLIPGIDMSALDLPPFDLILNTIAEPDVEPAALQTLDDYLSRHPQYPVLNRPDGVRETTRDRNFQRLQGIDGLTFPRTYRLHLDNAEPEALHAELSRVGLTAPIIIRPVGTQTGRGVGLLQTRADLAPLNTAPLTGEYYVIAFRKLLWRGTHFRKMRLFCIDGTYYPVVCYLDTYWNVHGNRKVQMADSPELMDEEKRFLQDWESYVGPRAVAALEEVARRTRLEFFGIDFTVDDDGAVFVYELNAAMRHHYGHLTLFPYKEPYDHAITEAFQSMVRRHLPAPAPAAQ